MFSPVIAHGAGGGGVGGSALASWGPLLGLLGVFAIAVVALFLFGRPAPEQPPLRRAALRIPEALERVTGIPGWAAASALLAMYALILAGVGFYSDVAYHIAFGRDEELFTPPHVAILIGLILIFVAGVAAVLLATLMRVETRLRWRSVRIPWSALPLLAIGTGAIIGFPVDELWHQAYGVDVTMWSPPHLMMILGATITGLAAWLVLAESGVSPRDSRWARGFHVAAAWLTLQGFMAPAGEFAFGVPQWQQLFHPVLVLLAGGMAVVMMRLVLGAGWALGVATVAFLLEWGGLLMVGGSPIETRPAGFFVASALAVELVAWVWGTDRRLRFALAAGVGVGTVGLAGEWLWNTGAHQPWTTALLPEAALVGLLAALAATVLGTALGGALCRRSIRLPAAALILAGIGMAASIVIPLPRPAGEVSVAVEIIDAGDGQARVAATLDPPDAADDARWFMVGAWRGGGRVSSPMLPEGDGRYVAEDAIPIDGEYKSLLRLHRGAEMMAVPIRLPEDAAIGDPGLPAEDRAMDFEAEDVFLQREAALYDASGPLFSRIVFALLAVMAVAWVGSLAVAAWGLSQAQGSPGVHAAREREPAAVDTATPG